MNYPRGIHNYSTFGTQRLREIIKQINTQTFLEPGNVVIYLENCGCSNCGRRNSF
jgi:hypothetical protein